MRKGNSGGTILEPDITIAFVKVRELYGSAPYPIPGICSLSQYLRTEKFYFLKFNTSGDSSDSKISCKITTFFTKVLARILIVNTIRCSYGVPTRHYH
ncbi:hypothetical protein HZS_5124 [Henneguya salminicola]|nr:hypothetical protein HZS_5124 [Henneguya salminicola]